MLAVRREIDWKHCFFPRCLRLRCLPLTAVVVLSGAMTAQIRQPKDEVHFRLYDGYLIMVQTRINDAGPFRFLVDTGTTRTVIDPELALQLQAPVIGEASLTGVLRVRQDKLVRLKNVRVGEASISGLGAVVDRLARQKTLAPGIRGVLGEDFLSRFDFLIDYKERTMHFGGAPPAGERCRFETIGRYHGSPTTNRLLIGVEFTEVSGAAVQLQLDTGAKMPELFPAGEVSLSSQPWGGFMATSNGANGTNIHSNITVKIGSTIVRGLDVVESRRAVAFDAAGLLPAAIFHRIYISHLGGFVVLNPGE
jgi:predicted aspartyl protease